jgi:hypothetical protein
MPNIEQRSMRIKKTKLDEFGIEINGMMLHSEEMQTHMYGLLKSKETMYLCK